MSSSSVPHSLRAAIERHLVPLLAPVEMAMVANPSRPRPGITSCTMARPLSGGRELVLQVWCDTPSRNKLTWRLDVHDGNLWRDLQLTLPSKREGFSPPPLGGSHHQLGEFHPERSPEDLGRAIAFLGPWLVACASEIAQQVPELAPELAAASETPAWTAAREAASRLWSYRAVSGDLDPTEMEAVVTFASANMVILDAGGRRVSFKFPGIEGVQKGDRASVSGWWTTLAGTYAATVFRIGSRTWRFDPSGNPVV